MRTVTLSRQKQRIVARTSLYGALVLLAVLLWLLLPWLQRSVQFIFDPFWDGKAYADRIEVRRLRELIAIDTTGDHGREADAARYLAEVLEQAGVTPTVTEFPDGRANLWAVLEGEQPEALILHSHLDTTPVGDPQAWLHPPLGGVIDGPWMYGRGAFDMKSTTVAQLQSFLEVKKRMDAGWRPHRSLVLLATSGEESGSALGTPWILATQSWLRQRAWAVLTEGGIYEGTDTNKIKYWGVSYGQKQFVTYWACSSDRQALESLAGQLAEQTRSAELRLAPEVEQYFGAYGPTRDFPVLRRPFLNPKWLLRDRSAFDRLPAYIQALFRDEVYPLSAVQVEPGSGGFRLAISLHVLPGSDPEEVAHRLIPSWMLGGIRLVKSETSVPARTSPLGHPAYQLLMRALREHFPNAAIGPIFLPWFDNDGRFFRQAGIPTYGFFPFRAFSADSFSMDTGVEKIMVGAYSEGVGTYVEVVATLVG